MVPVVVGLFEGVLVGVELFFELVVEVVVVMGEIFGICLKPLIFEKKWQNSFFF